MMSHARTTRRLFALLFIVSLGVIISPPTTSALIVHGDTTHNRNPTTHLQAPLHEPGWHNVGHRRSTGIYLGNRWVILAHHTGAGPIILGGVEYEQDLTTDAVRLRNPDDSPTDLLMFRLVDDPGLPSLRIAVTPPTSGEQLTLIGTGWGRGSELKTYTLTSGGTATGYDWTGSRTKTWGYNNLLFRTTTSYGHGTVHALVTRFDAVEGQAQAAWDDSGGAVFNASGELAGIIVAITGQTHRSTFGNLTYSADLSVYREQIVTIVPEPGTLLSLIVMSAWILHRSRTRPGCV
jgi:hypothetical protein